MVLGIQVAGALFGAFLMYYTFLKHKKKDINGKEYGLWMGVWGLFIIVSLFPGILDPVVKTLSVVRTFDLLVISGFLFVIGLTFYTYTIVVRNRNQVEELVRTIALSGRKRKR